MLFITVLRWRRIQRLRFGMKFLLQVFIFVIFLLFFFWQFPKLITQNLLSLIPNRKNPWIYHLGHFKRVEKMARFSLRATSSLIAGDRGVPVPCYSIRDCNLGHFKWYTKSTTPPKIKDGKWRIFPSARLHFGGRGISVPCYSVRDCRCPQLNNSNL